MNKAYIYIGVVLVVAVVVTLMVGEIGVNLIKASGVFASVVIVGPVFLLLRRAMATGSMNRILGTFVGGFFFKLIGVLLIVWLIVGKAGWNQIDFTVSCLAFLIAFQIAEAIYFWGGSNKR